jgi:hypothetical protein
MESEKSLSHTVWAIIVCIGIYLFMIYVITPILDNVLTIFGIFFIPERYGGGSEAQHKGLLQIIFWGLVQNGISAYCSIKISIKTFCNSNNKAVAAVLMIFVCMLAVIFTYVFLVKEGIIALIIPLLFVPTIYFAVKLWKHNDI